MGRPRRRKLLAGLFYARPHPLTSRCSRQREVGGCSSLEREGEKKGARREAKQRAENTPGDATESLTARFAGYGEVRKVDRLNTISRSSRGGGRSVATGRNSEREEGKKKRVCAGPVVLLPPNEPPFSTPGHRQREEIHRAATEGSDKAADREERTEAKKKDCQRHLHHLQSLLRGLQDCGLLLLLRHGSKRRRTGGVTVGRDGGGCSGGRGRRRASK